MKITSRAAWGARKPTQNPIHVAPSRRVFFVVHHSGGPITQSVREIQNWCMDGRGFADIDYNLLVRGSTGEIYEGRGWDIVGAHTTGYNTAAYGVCVIGNDQISDAAKASVRSLYEAAIARSGHGLSVKGHRQLATTGTECPGDKVFSWVSGGMILGKATPTPTGPRTLRRGMTGADVKALQTKLGVTADGAFGPKTEAAVIAYQKLHHLDPDGAVGPMTRAALGLKS